MIHDLNIMEYITSKILNINYLNFKLGALIGSEIYQLRIQHLSLPYLETLPLNLYVIS